MNVEGRDRGEAVDVNRIEDRIVLTVRFFDAAAVLREASLTLDENWASTLVLELQAKVAGIQARAVSR